MSAANIKVRFTSSLLVLLIFGLVLSVSLRLLYLNVSLCGYLPVLIGAFLFEWYRLHGSALSRAPRALFDEANILETYQPRARTMGHLFEAEPPTPVPEDTKEAKEQRDAFKTMRDAHYANEFSEITRLNEEAKVISLNSRQVSTPPSQTFRVELTRTKEEEDPEDEL